jgi:cell division protein FtsW
MNMGYVVGLLPVTGVQLPLISAGGTSLVLTLFIVGLLARFARSEPEAIEAQRGRTRGPLARFFLPVPASAVDAVRPRRRPEERPSTRPVGNGGRTLVHARPGVPQPVPPRQPRTPDPSAGRRPAVPPGDAVPPRSAPVRPRREDPARAGARPAPGVGRPRRTGGSR